MDVPPKSLSRNVRQQIVARSPSALDDHLSSDLTTSPGSLPVLEAFQEFLDTERKRMKHRIMIMSTSIVSIMLALGTVVILINRASTRQFKNDLESALADATSAKNLVDDLRRNTTRTIADLSSKSERQNEALSTQMENIEEDRAKLTSQLDTYKDKMATLDRTIQSLKEENGDLMQQLQDTQDQLPELTSGLAKAMEQIEELRTTSPAIASVRRTTPARTVRQERRSSRPSMRLILQPLGRHEEISWRLPLP